MSLSVQVAANVKAMRKARGMSQHDLAAALAEVGCAVGRYVLANWETGRRLVITVDELAALAVVFAVEPWSLTELHVVCLNCKGSPPEGFACRVCGAKS